MTVRRPATSLATIASPSSSIALAAAAAAAAFAGVLAAGLPGPRASRVLWGRRDPARSSLQGNVEVRQVNLGFKVAGRIEKLARRRGRRRSSAGQPLASLEKVYFEDALAQARGARDQAAANYAKMKAGNRAEDIAQAEATLTASRRRCRTRPRRSTAPQALLNSASGTIKSLRRRARRRSAKPPRASMSRAHALDADARPASASRTSTRRPPSSRSRTPR